jgi:MoaA/NifB/PqqE/SkfB family radical SAM enzyme
MNRQKRGNRPAYKLNNILLELTLKCNEKCPHCYIPKNGNDCDIFMFFENAKKYLEQASRLGVQEITFSGGEPFLNKDILKILQFAEKLNFSHIYVLSNLTLIKEKHISVLEKLKSITIQTTLFSTKADIHDKITGFKGSHLKTTELIKLLNNKGVKVQISCPLLKQNYQTFRELQRWADDLDYKFYPNFDIVAQTNFNTSTLRNAVNNQQKVDLIKELIILDKHPFWSKWKGVNQETESELSLFENPCEAGISQITIAPNGDVFPCMLWHIAGVGNLNDMSLKDIWANSTILNKIRNTRMKDFDLNGSDIMKYIKICYARNANSSAGDYLHIAKSDFEYAELLKKMVNEVNDVN